MSTEIVDSAAPFRRELVAYCHRMLGSAAEAEDATQETMVRAWRKSEGFEGRSSLRSWLYKIATNVCIDMQRAPQRRALPIDLNAPSSMSGSVNIGVPLEETIWIGPVHDSQILADSGDPAERALLRDSVRLAFVAALQHLPARQRAILVLREVLDWSAAEVAELLEMSVDSVTSALARARATVKKVDTSAGTPLGEDDRSLLDRYVAAFEAYDVTGLVALLQEDANFSMPPYEFWIRGASEIEKWWRGPGRDACIGSRVVVTQANGSPAAAVYHPAGDHLWKPFAIHVFEVRDGRIAAICHFLDVGLFAEFGLPAQLT